MGSGSIGRYAHDSRSRLRRELRRFWNVDRDGAAELVNAMLQVEAAMAFVDVIRADEHRRLRLCEADDCDAVVIDLSRNRSKRYCDVGNCGNRMNVTAFRARRAASGE